ncbi:hypothetical protein NQZ68_038109 [Dissostichus eleginoides]|nr:hypothetical protein NQZ68_038109 [Dissostichus eleginoides]
MASEASKQQVREDVFIFTILLFPRAALRRQGDEGGAAAVSQHHHGPLQQAATCRTPVASTGIMANTTNGTRDRRDSRCGLSGEAIVQNGCVVTDLAASDLHNHTNYHHDLSSTMHSEMVVPTYKPSCSSTPIYYCSPQKNYSDLNQDCHSLTSQDSGIPTLEINPPEPILHAHQRTGDGGLVSDSSSYSPATLTLEDSTDGNSIRKSSTFPRSGYDSIRHLSPALRLSTTMGTAVGALNRSDDISSMSSMSTELSVSNEDILDFTVTSSSSAIVTLETDDSSGSHFTDVTLTTSPGNPGDLWSPVRGPHQEEDGRLKKLGPLASLFNRKHWKFGQK